MFGVRAIYGDLCYYGSTIRTPLGARALPSVACPLRVQCNLVADP